MHDRMLPLRLMGSCVIELELDEVQKWATQETGSLGTVASHANDIELSEARILVDELIIDPALDNEIVQKVSSGTPIPLLYNTFVTSMTNELRGEPERATHHSHVPGALASAPALLHLRL